MPGPVALRDSELDRSHLRPLEKGWGEGLSVPAGTNFQMPNGHHRKSVSPAINHIGAGGRALSASRPQRLIGTRMSFGSKTA